MKRLIFDLDGTICHAVDGDYSNARVDEEVVSKLNSYKEAGFEIVISTSRNVRTYDGDVGKINANTLPIIIQWLDMNNIPYDEIYVGKPWCGFDGFYIDDKAIRPYEFVKMSYAEITNLLSLK